MSGGDTSPLIALQMGLRHRGHVTAAILDDSELEQDIAADQALTLPPSADATAHSEHLAAVPDHPSKASVQWARAALPFVQEFVESFRPDVVICSDTTLTLGVLLRSVVGTPLCFLNSTFSYASSLPSDLTADFSFEALPWIRFIRALIGEVNLVLNATDPVFDAVHKSTSYSKERWIGPLFWERNRPVPDYLSSRNDWILLTTSTAPQIGEREFVRTILRYLINFPNVVTTVPFSQTEIDIPTKAHIERYLPHSLILKRAKLTIAHSGHGIVMKSLQYGVPMVLVPWGRDQLGVARRAQSLKVAEVLAKRELTESAIKAKMSVAEDCRKYLKHHAMRLQHTDACETAERHLLRLVDDSPS